MHRMLSRIYRQKQSIFVSCIFLVGGFANLSFYNWLEIELEFGPLLGGSPFFNERTCRYLCSLF
jgi:hypothetical protein